MSPPATDIWMTPCGSGSTDWAAFEKMLDGESKVPEEEHREEYWGKGTAAHFWGSEQKPVRRPIANVVPIARGEDWKTAPIDAKKDSDVLNMYRTKLGVSRWPQGAPAAVDDKRALGAVVAAPKQKMLVAGAVSLRGLFVAPLNPSQREDVRKAAHDDFLAATGLNMVVTSLRSTDTGTRITFHVDSSKAEAKSVLDKIKRTLPAAKVNVINNLCVNFKVRPSGQASVEGSKCQVVVRPRTCVRGDPATGAAASEDMDLGGKVASSSYATRTPSSAGVASGSRAGHTAASSPSRGSGSAVRPSTVSPSHASGSSRSGAGTPSKPTVAGTIKRMPGAGYSAPEPEKPMSAAEKRKALLGKVMHKTKVQLTKIESETPHVPATHELQQRKEAITMANLKLAKKQGITNAAKEEAKQNLKPPSSWMGALVRTENGRKVFENFELQIVEFVKETMCLVGRARVQNGKMDVTYQAKTRVLAKDNEMVVEIVLDSSGVCRGGFDKPGQIAGTFKFPNGAGTFKLMRIASD